jgi:cyclophilin family peptidyl-prolyl cis-trans isomerase
MRSLIFTLVLAAMVPFAAQAQKAKKEAAPANDAVIHTSMGDIYVVLYDETPKHKENFLKLALAHTYDSTTFHRVIKEFMIQGGDPYSKDPAKKNMAGQGGMGYTIPAEINAKFYHHKGALAAARMGDQVNPNRESSGCQFYIVSGKVFTMAEIESAEKRIKSMVGPEFAFTTEQKTAYTTVGGSPWLDQQYTVYGHVTQGLDVVDKIGAVLTAPGDRPLQDITMTVEALTDLGKWKKKMAKLAKKKAKEKAPK